MCDCISPILLPQSSPVSTRRFFHIHKSLFINGSQHLNLNLQLANNQNHFTSSCCFRPQRAKNNIPNLENQFSDDDLRNEDAEIPLNSAVGNGISNDDEDNGVRFRGETEELTEKRIVRRRSIKRMMKRSSMIAKQVISISSAISLGFVSQLWVDVNSWIVFLVEVRPTLLSGEVEMFLLEDVKQVGDVVLVEDEAVMENEFKLVGLQTLVGYNVVTPGQRNIGKVRGYTFNINSGEVEFLELDCLGISIIPSRLVSTYCLFVEDVVDILPDTIVVEEAAASRLQRLTKGFWDAQKMTYSNKIEDYSDLTDRQSKPEYHRRGKKSSGKRLRRKLKELADDWELPMDFF